MIAKEGRGRGSRMSTGISVTLDLCNEGEGR